MTQWATQLVVMFLVTGVGTFVSAQDQLQEQPREQDQFFEKEIRPLLAEHCFECHSGTAQKGVFSWIHLRECWLEANPGQP